MLYAFLKYFFSNYNQRRRALFPQTWILNSEMDFQTIVLNDLEDSLGCSMCDNYLSYFPISICSNSQHVCGRCTIPDGVTSFRDTAYETLAQFLKFPCRYSIEGCFEEVLPSRMKEHEENCSFREVGCIVEKPSKCEWKGSLAHLFEHCRDEHSQLILEDGEFEVSVDNSQEYDSLIEVEGSFFIFRRKFDVENRILEFTVFNNQYDSNTNTCDFELSARNSRKVVLIEFQSSPYINHVFGNFDLNHVTTESHEDVNFKISRRKKSDFEGLSQKKNSELLEVLKCSNCSNFLIPPIYQRMEGSNNYFCSGCKNKYDENGSGFSDNGKLFTQSVVLEKIASLVTYPCENYENGCLFKGAYPEIKLHQLSCRLKKRKCPGFVFSAKACTWEGLEKDIYQHVFEDFNKHRLIKFTPNFKLSFKKKLGRTSLNIHFGDRIFLFSHGLKDSHYFWSLSKISPCSDRFRYEIVIVNETDEERRLSVGKPCCNSFEEFISDRHKTATNKDYECIVNNDQFSSVFEEKSESSTFHLRIFKC